MLPTSIARVAFAALIVCGGRSIVIWPVPSIAPLARFAAGFKWTARSSVTTTGMVMSDPPAALDTASAPTAHSPVTRAVFPSFATSIFVFFTSFATFRVSIWASLIVRPHPAVMDLSNPFVGPARVAAGKEWQQMVRRRFAEAFETADLLVTPTTPTMRKVIGEDMIGDRHYRAVLSWFSALVNHALLPAIALPLAGTGAPPVSLQAIGPLGSETALIGFGRSLVDAGVAGFRPGANGIG